MRIKKKPLPIDAKREEIEEALKNNRVVILTGPTGSGKSTRIGQYLLKMRESAIITQSSRFVVKSLAERVAKEYDCELGTTVGYRFSGERMDSGDSTDLLFATTGLALVREIMGHNTFGYLCIDDLEWTLDEEMLVAWCKRILSESDLKLVLMSATLDVAPLMDFFKPFDPVAINVQERGFPINERQSIKSIVAEAADFVRKGENVVQVFAGGKAEVEATIKGLEALLSSRAVILPLHGELTPEEQDLCLRNYGKPKVIVSTSYGQNGHTLPGAVVVDCGYEHVPEVEWGDGDEGFGVEVLRRVLSSQATCKQRAGRSGRTGPGEYVWCSTDKFEDRPLFTKPAIQRSSLESVVLRLKLAGLDIEDLEFLHAPSPVAIRQAKSLLRLLGAFDSNNELTDLGRRMARLPVGARTARMLLEAKMRGVLDEMITVAAIIERDGIVHHRSHEWRSLCKEGPSDALAQLQIWNASRHLTMEQMYACGINLKAHREVEALRKRLNEALLGRTLPKPEGDLTAESEQLLSRCIASGMVDRLYRYDSGGYTNGDDKRSLGTNTVLSPKTPWVVGRPRNLLLRHDGQEVKILTMATTVKPEWLMKFAPQLFEVKQGLNPRYDATQDVVVVDDETWFDGKLITRQHVPSPDHPRTEELKHKYESAAPILPANLATQSAAEREHHAAKIRNLRAVGLRTKVRELHEAHGDNHDLGAAFRAQIESYLQLPPAADPDEMRQWISGAESLLNQLESELALAKSRAHEDAATIGPSTNLAKVLRNSVNKLLVDDYERDMPLLDDPLYERLKKLDVDNDQLPMTLEGLKSWMTVATTAISEANKLL